MNGRAQSLKATIDDKERQAQVLELERRIIDGRIQALRSEVHLLKAELQLLGRDTADQWRRE